MLGWSSPQGQFRILCPKCHAPPQFECEQNMRQFLYICYKCELTFTIPLEVFLSAERGSEIETDMRSYQFYKALEQAKREATLEKLRTWVQAAVEPIYALWR